MTGGPLNSHMAWLAEAQKVRQDIGLSSTREQPIRPDVMDRDGRADDKSALLASAAVSFYRSPARFRPALASISGYAANVICRVFPGLLGGLPCGMTRPAAKSPTALGFVLALQPRLNLKRTAALGADMDSPLDGVHRLRLFGRECVSGPKTAPPLVPNLMIARHFADGHMPFAAALVRAKPRNFSAIRFDRKLASTNLAIKLCHARILARTMGVAKFADVRAA